MTGAARSLHVTQPTLSRQLQDLEDELGQELFIRGSHSLNLTVEGDAASQTGGRDSGHGSQNGIRIQLHRRPYCRGYSYRRRRNRGDAANRTSDPGDSKRLSEIRFHLFSGNAEDVTERLDKGILDFGLLIQPVDILKYDSIRLPDKVTWGVVMRRDSPLAEKQAVTQQDLLELPLICSRQVVQRLKQKNEYSDWFGENRRKMEHCCDLQPDLQRRIDGEGGDRLCDCLDRLVNMTGHTGLCFRPLKPGLKSGMNLVWKKYQVFSPGRTAFSGTGAGKIRSENRKHAEAASLLPGSCPDRK